MLLRFCEFRSPLRWAMIAFLGAAGAQAQDGVGSSPQEIAFFEARIRPVLVAHCDECHSANSKIVRGGLRLDSRTASQKRGDSGPVIVPGKPEESLLIQAIKHESLAMPPNKKLPDAVIADFETWIRRGAVDPREEVKAGGLKPV